MKIGLLECDHVLPDLQRIGGDYRDMFPALLPAAFEFVNYDVCKGQLPASPAECDAWLCTGSKHSVYEEIGWVLALKDFVRKLNEQRVKFIGVCFGHQMLGEALGGKVQKGTMGWCVGVHAFEICEMESWMDPYHTHINLLMSCQDQVVVLPENSKVLATAKDCPVSMFQVGDHALGIQAHPEFPLEYAAALMEKRVERIGVEKVEQARETFSLSLHDRVIAQWMVRFLKG